MEHRRIYNVIIWKGMRALESCNIASCNIVSCNRGLSLFLHYKIPNLINCHLKWMSLYFATEVDVFEDITFFVISFLLISQIPRVQFFCLYFSQLLNRGLNLILILCSNRNHGETLLESTAYWNSGIEEMLTRNKFINKLFSTRPVLY